MKRVGGVGKVDKVDLGTFVVGGEREDEFAP